jgi:hypothetical protein
MPDVLGLSRSILPYVVFAVSLPVGLATAAIVVTLVAGRARATRDDTPAEAVNSQSLEPIDMGRGMVPTLDGIGNRLLFIGVCLAVMAAMQIVCSATALE